MALRTGLIGIVGKELEEDFWGTLDRIAAIGYQGIEAGGSTLAKAKAPLPEVKRRLDGLGLRPIAYHATKYSFAESGDQILANVQALGCGILVLSWGPCESREQLLEDAALYNQIGERCRANGIQLTYHNHDHEFQRLGGETGFDILMGNAEPELLQAHLDVAWVAFGGVDPAGLIRKYAGRCPALHIKDLARLEPGCETARGNRKEAQFTEVGTGILDLPTIVATARESGDEWLTVEQDRMRDLPTMQSIQVSFDNLQRALA